MVGRSVGWLVGRSVCLLAGRPFCHNRAGSYTSTLLSEQLFYYCYSIQYWNPTVNVMIPTRCLHPEVEFLANEGLQLRFNYKQRKNVERSVTTFNVWGQRKQISHWGSYWIWARLANRDATHIKCSRRKYVGMSFISDHIFLWYAVSCTPIFCTSSYYSSS